MGAEILLDIDGFTLRNGFLCLHVVGELNVIAKDSIDQVIYSPCILHFLGNIWFHNCPLSYLGPRVFPPTWIYSHLPIQSFGNVKAQLSACPQAGYKLTWN